MNDPRVELVSKIAGESGNLPALVADLDRTEIAIRTSRHHGVLGLSIANLISRLTPRVRVELEAPASSSTFVDEMALKFTRALPEFGSSPSKRRLTVDVGLGGPNADLYVSADAWNMRLSGRPHQTLHGEGPAVVASSALAAGELFRRVVPIPGTHLGGGDVLEWNLIDYTLSIVPHQNPRGPVSATCYGAGSVGSSIAYCLILSNASGSVTFVDADSLKSRNRLRYPLWIRPSESGTKVGWLQRHSTPYLSFVGVCRSAAEHIHTQEEATRLAVSAVDTVSARRDIADALARRTLNIGVDALQFHVSLHGFSDGLACVYCPYVDLGDQVNEEAMYARLTGLPPARVAELLAGATLGSADLAIMIDLGRVGQGDASELMGGRIQDAARLRLYAQANVSLGQETFAISAPFVSALAGAIVGAELLKSGAALESCALDRRVDVDMSGFPTGFQSRPPQDSSGRCLCRDPLRVGQYQSLWGPR